MSIIRVVPGGPWAVWDSENESTVTLSEGMEFDDGDPIVGQFPWAFASDTAAVRPARKRATAVETASAEPGAKRNR